MSKPHLGSKHSVVGSTSQIWDCGSLNLVFPLTQQWVCGRLRLRLRTWLRQQDTGKSKTLLFCFLVWHTWIARNLGFLSAICSQGSSWFGKRFGRRIWGHNYCCGWKGSFGNRLSSQSSHILSNTEQQNCLLDLYCPSSALFFSSLGLISHESFHMESVPAWGIWRGICMLQSPVKLIGDVGTAWMALNKSELHFFTILQEVLCSQEVLWQPSLLLKNFEDGQGKLSKCCESPCLDTWFP